MSVTDGGEVASTKRNETKQQHQFNIIDCEFCGANESILVHTFNKPGSVCVIDSCMTNLQPQVKVAVISSNYCRRQHVHRTCAVRAVDGWFFLIPTVALLVWVVDPEGCHSMSLFTSQPKKTTAVAGPFALNVELNLQPARRQEFLQIIQYDQQQTILQEQGALQFTIGADTMDEYKFHLHEQYRSPADFDIHCTTAHYQQWQDFCDSHPFTADPIVQSYTLRPMDHNNNNNHATTTTVDPSSLPLSVHSTFCLNVELCIHDNVRAEFLTVIEKNQIGSRTTEPLCRQYDYGESMTTPNTFYFHEQYVGAHHGKEGFDAHAVTEHFQKWEEFAAKPNSFTKDPVVHFYHGTTCISRRESMIGSDNC
jgi:quinol monooxygenase YgiN